MMTVLLILAAVLILFISYKAAKWVLNELKELWHDLTSPGMPTGKKDYIIAKDAVIVTNNGKPVAYSTDEGVFYV